MLTGASGAQQAHPLLRAEYVAAADMLGALKSLRLEQEPEAAEEDEFAEFEGLNPLERIQRQAAQLRGRRGR